MRFVHRETVRLAERMPQADIILARTVWPTRIGTKSFELSYELRAGGRLVAEAKSVLVGYDYERFESTEIPERGKGD